jgi:hypothetical protein
LGQEQSRSDATTPLLQYREEEDVMHVLSAQATVRRRV